MTTNANPFDLIPVTEAAVLVSRTDLTNMKWEEVLTCTRAQVNAYVQNSPFCDALYKLADAHCVKRGYKPPVASVDCPPPPPQPRPVPPTCAVACARLVSIIRKTPAGGGGPSTVRSSMIYKSGGGGGKSLVQRASV